MTNALTRTTQGKRNGGHYELVSPDSTDEGIVHLWLNSGKRGNSPATQGVYLRTWREFSAFVRLPLQNVTLADLQAWQASLIGKPATRRTKIAAIRSLFSFCVRVGYLHLSPAVMLEPPHAPQNPQAHVVSVADLARLLDACQTAQETALLRVLYSSGARISEVLSLKWQDVGEREDGKGAHLFIASGKGRKSRRVGVNASAYAALLALYEEASQPSARQKDTWMHDIYPYKDARTNVPPISMANFVFSTRTGKALDRHAAHRLLKGILKRAGVKNAQDASLHWLRHSHATHALQQGANVADVKEQLGHASLNTTSLYAHSSAYSSDKLPL